MTDSAKAIKIGEKKHEKKRKRKEEQYEGKRLVEKSSDIPDLSAQL